MDAVQPADRVRRGGHVPFCTLSSGPDRRSAYSSVGRHTDFDAPPARSRSSAASAENLPGTDLSPKITATLTSPRWPGVPPDPLRCRSATDRTDPVRTVGHMNPRSDVVGSLLRPALPASRRASRLERGELTPAEFKRIEDRAVDEAVALQEQRRARRRHRRRDAPLRVLRPPGRGARGIRQACAAGRSPSATARGTRRRCSGRSSSRSCAGAGR